MQLNSISVEKFKRIDKVHLELADVTILVGANGSGKSSIIQAVHLACCVLRQAAGVEAYKTSTVEISQLDYLPSDNYRRLGHKADWGNKVGTPSSKVALTFGDSNQDFEAECELRSARNAGISITGHVPTVLSEKLRNKRNFFSAYIPGISGIPNKEEKRSKKVVFKACSFGDSNVILRNALLLLSQENGSMALLQDWIGKIIGPVRIVVDHREERDLFIDCSISVHGDTVPIELVGTGYLQLIQIFAYVLLFKPGVLLIDEPDIHLHPTVQEKLVAVLAEVAKLQQLRVIITTHSPFVVRGAPLSSRVYWLREGTVDSQDRNRVELLLGWGAFGKKVIFVSEDSDTSLLKKLVSQWPEIERSVAFYPGGGFKHLPTPDQAEAMKSALGDSFKVLIHRDRDSLTDAEVDQLGKSYASRGIDFWAPDDTDVEAYFCSPQLIAAITGCDEDQAAGYINSAVSKNSIPIRQQFDRQRAAHNKELYESGGSPINEDVWKAKLVRPLQGAKGKYIFSQLKNVIPANQFNEQKILQHNALPPMAVDLKLKLEQLIGT
jgi:predicted ATPase